MIYKLDTDFSKIEQADGLMQNLSYQAYVEVVSCVEDPRKDSGIILLPFEKINFKAKKGESVFARSAHIGGTPANISVVNFNVPASVSGAGIGSITYAHTVLDGYVRADGSLINRDDYPDLFEYADANELFLLETDWANGMQGMYSISDDSTTFRVPDLRGQFLRGVDGGAGIDDTDRVIGSRQNGSLMIADDGNDVNGLAIGADSISNIYNYDVPKLENYPNRSSVSTYLPDKVIKDYYNSYINYWGVARPTNIALIAQIKY